MVSIPAGPSLLASLSEFCILLPLRCAPGRTARSYNEFIPIQSSKLDGRWPVLFSSGDVAGEFYLKPFSDLDECQSPDASPQVLIFLLWILESIQVQVI